MGVGHDIEVENAGWTFGGNTPDTFVDHIRQSVPLYEEGHSLTCQLSDFSKPSAKWIGLDPIDTMIDNARDHCKDVKNIEILHEDARLFEFEKSDLIVSYYCMQFIPPRDRQALFDKIYESLNWGGAFIMFEKVRAPDARFQDIIR